MFISGGGGGGNIKALYFYTSAVYIVNGKYATAISGVQLEMYAVAGHKGGDRSLQEFPYFHRFRVI